MECFMASPPSPVSQNSIVISGVSINSSVCSSCNGGSTGGAAAAAGVEKLVSDIESLLYRPADETFSDVIIHVDGKRVAAHRCILAVRCPYFRRFFAAAAENKNKNKEEKREEDATKAVEVKLETLMKNNDKGEKVGYEAFMAVMGYVYGSGGMNPVVCSSSVSCLDPSCPHITCRPAIEFVLEILRASSILEISELKAAAQVHHHPPPSIFFCNFVLFCFFLREFHHRGGRSSCCLLLPLVVVVVVVWMDGRFFLREFYHWGGDLVFFFLFLFLLFCY
jgi:regulatory protein NPR1